MGTFASQGIWQWRTEKSAQCIPQNIQGLRGLHKKCLITHQVELKVNGRKKRKFSQNIFCKPWLDLSSKKEEETKIKFGNFRLYFFITWWDSNRWNTKTNAIDVGNSVSYFCCITTTINLLQVRDERTRADTRKVVMYTYYLRWIKHGLLGTVGTSIYLYHLKRFNVCKIVQSLAGGSPIVIRFLAPLIHGLS